MDHMHTDAPIPFADLRGHLMSAHHWTLDSEGFASMDEAAMRASHAEDHAE